MDHVRPALASLTTRERQEYELLRAEWIQRQISGRKVEWRADFAAYDPSKPPIARLDGVLTYGLHLHQLAAHDLAKKFQITVMSGGVRNGKTRWAGTQLIDLVVNRPAPPPTIPRIYWIIVPELTPYWDNIRPEIEMILGNVEDGGLIISKRDSPKPSYKLRANDGGDPWEVVVMSALDPDRLRSASIAGAHITEAEKMHEDALDNTLERLAFSGGPLFVETSPWGLGWVWRRLLERAAVQIDFRTGKPEVTTRSDGDPRVGAIRGVPIEANKAIPADRLATLRAQASTERARKEYDGEHFAASGLIWAAFHPIRHVTREITPELLKKDKRPWEIVAGHDFGFGHPEAHVFVATDGWRYWVVDEYREPELTFREHSENIKKSEWFSLTTWTYADPSGAQAQTEYMDLGIAMSPGANDVELGINCVAQLFESGRLKISAKCKKLIEEIGSWMRNEKTGRPHHLLEDLCAALRYCLYSHSLMNDGKPNDYGTIRNGRLYVGRGNDDEILDAGWKAVDTSEYLADDGAVKEVV